MVQRQIDELLAIRASEWFELLPTASPAQLHELQAWLSESKVHVQEFLEIAAVDLALGGLDRQRQHDIETLLGRILPKVVPIRPRPAAAAAAQAPAWRRSWKIGAMAASWVALALVSTMTGWKPAPPEQEYTTAIGEHRAVQLADRSLVTMNADSHIDVNFGKSAREIALVRGEATFQVAHDAARPFRVHTRAGIVQAMGTKFNVRNLMNGVTRVSLLEGQVHLESRSHQMTLSAGEEVDILLDGSFAPRADATVANAIAWQARRLVFEAAPLTEVVQEFNRQNRTLRLRVDGVDGVSHRYDGIFDANAPDALVQVLALEPDLKVEHVGNELIIRPKHRPSQPVERGVSATSAQGALE
ncbi:FecR family protein [Peristeroidobacter soli]|uniref:FecR family protein n=1 Tax=Peristeroidobacter soli TaxID=2497877 RepID=UPI00101C1E3F|nr:FecR domain-containing protein [Peristeroidobacter soli]